VVVSLAGLPFLGGFVYPDFMTQQERKRILEAIEKWLRKDMPNELKAERIFVDVVCKVVDEARADWTKLIYVDSDTAH
jgi:hypothetical protein